MSAQNIQKIKERFLGFDRKARSLIGREDYRISLNPFQDNIRFPSTEFYDYYIENHKTIRQETNTAEVKTFIGRFFSLILKLRLIVKLMLVKVSTEID